MTRSKGLLVILALAGIIAAPLATIHPLAGHLRDAGAAGLPHELRDVALIVLFLFVGGSLVPLAGVARVAVTWVRQANVLSGLRAASEPRTTGDGLAHYLFQAQGVHFFTAGFFRPRIYASTAAFEQLSTGAFRAAILHEREHQRRHHVRWRLALAALETAFRPFPPVRRAVGALALDCEFAADRAALDAGAEPRHLFDAVVAASRSLQPSSSIGLSGTGTLERLEALATSEHQPSGSGGALFWLVAALAGFPLLAHLAFWAGAVCLSATGAGGG